MVKEDSSDKWALPFQQTAARMYVMYCYLDTSAKKELSDHLAIAIARQPSARTHRIKMLCWFRWLDQ